MGLAAFEDAVDFFFEAEEPLADDSAENGGRSCRKMFPTISGAG
jgi:hypothetical protein